MDETDQATRQKSSEMRATRTETDDIREESRVQREQANQDSPLLKLAPELRNSIFSLALPSDQYFTAAPESQELYLVGLHDDDTTSSKIQETDAESPEAQPHKTVRKSESFQRHFGITQVCRQTRSDALKLAYAADTFLVPVLSQDEKITVEKWLDSRPAEVLPLINKIGLQTGLASYTCFPSEEAVTILFDFKTGSAEIVFNEDPTVDCPACLQVFCNTVKYYHKMAERVSSSSIPKGRLLNLVKESRTFASSPESMLGIGGSVKADMGGSGRIRRKGREARRPSAA